MSMFCLTTIDREKILYKSVSDIPVCPRLAGKGMAGMVMAIPIFTAPRSNTSKGLAISMYAATS